MPRWGYVLLVLFVVLGLSPLPRRKAANIAVIVVVFTLGYAFHKYGGLH